MMDDCPLGPCDFPLAGAPCQFWRGCGEAFDRIEGSGHAVVKVGEVPPWMEPVVIGDGFLRVDTPNGIRPLYLDKQ